VVIYALTISSTIKDSPGLIVLRSGRYFAYYVKKLIAIAVFTISIVLFHIIILLVIGSFKHSWNNGFTDSLDSFGYLTELIIPFKNNFHVPLTALLSTCLYFSLGLSAIASLLTLLSHHFFEKVVILTEVCAYLIMIITLQLNVDRTAPLFFINNYLFLHRAIGYNVPVATTLITLTVLSTMMFLSNQQRKRIMNHLINLAPMKIFGEILSRKNIVSVFIILFTLSFVSVLKYRLDSNTGLDFTVRIFWGYGIGYLNIIEFLHLMLINGIPIYLLSIYFSNKSSMRSIVMVRYKRIPTWFLNIQFSMVALILIQLVLMCIFVFSIGSINQTFSGLRNINIGDEYLSFNNPVLLIIIGFTLRVFELMFTQMIFLVLLSITKNTTAAFLITMSMYLTIVIFSNKFIPFGLSSLSRVLELSKSGLLANSTISAITFAGCYVLMYIYIWI
jgi:hypothetical protein